MMLSVILLLFADRTTLYSKCDQASDLRDTVNWGRKWLVDFNAGKTQQVSFDWSSSTCVIDVKMDGSVLEEKSYSKMMGLTFSSKLD